MSFLLCSVYKLTFDLLCNSITCYWKALNISWNSAWNFWQCEVLECGENAFFCIIHMPQPMLCFNWCHVMCHLAGTHALCFITLHVFGTPIFLSECMNSNISCHVVVPGINHDWVRWKIFRWHLYLSVCVLFPSLLNVGFWNLLCFAALHIFVFLVWLIIILTLSDIIWNTIKLSSPHGLLFYQHSEWTVMLNGSELIILQNGLFCLPTTLATIQQCTLWFGSAWSFRWACTMLALHMWI